MESNKFSRDGLLDFLKQSAIAGALNPATARSRRNAAEQLLTQLTTEEASDLRQLDVDELCSRFHKLQDSSIRPETLKIYNSRLKSALQDYFAWLDNPDDFVSAGGETRPQPVKRAQAGRKSAEEKALEGIRLTATSMPADLLPIPLRPDRVVYIQNLPLDLTADEAEKIQRVVGALAVARDSDS
ncbi:MAG: hypothetical protein QNJ40_07550 [Xanthomonadales bacterium]|nr:hypothetical protein [Xanthomonadales bacterium]